MWVRERCRRDSFCSTQLTTVRRGLTEFLPRRSSDVEQAQGKKITALEANVREMEETLRRKDSVMQRMEENLTAKIRDLQSEVKKKEESLENRVNEINDLKSKIERETDSAVGVGYSDIEIGSG